MTDQRDDNTDKIIRPIVPAGTNTTAIPTKPLTALDRLSRIIRMLCGLAALIAVGTSIWMFLGFLENDTGFLHLLSAFGLCFGVGALAFVPGLWIANLARATRLHGPRKKVAIITALLAWPWGVMGYLLLRLGGPWVWLGSGIIGLVIFITIWIVAVFIGAGRARRAA